MPMVKTRKSKARPKTQYRAMVPRGPKLAPSTNYFDVAYTSYQGNTTGSIALLNTIPNGTTQQTRIGKDIRLKSIEVRGIVNSEASTLISQSAWMLVYDRRPGTALPVIQDVLTNVIWSAFPNDDNVNRFKILCREDYVNVGSGTVPVTDTAAENVHKYYKVPAKYAKVAYKSLGTGAIADIDEGAVYLIVVGGNSAGAADTTISLAFRTRFFDVIG